MSVEKSYATGLRCVACDVRYPLGPLFEGCSACASDEFQSGLTPTYDYTDIRATLGGGSLHENGEGIWRYRRLLPVSVRAHETSLGEGNTPLVPMPRLAAEFGAAELWLKDESRNPTLSFKDRHAAVTLSKALDFNATTVIASSSGNHGMAVAAYAARAGLPCVVLTYPGISTAASAMIRAYGARLAVTTPEGRWAIIRRAVKERGWYPATNFTAIPTNGAYGHEGYKTIAYELFEQLGGRIPDLVVLPVGYGEGLFGIWKGFSELNLLGRASALPRMVAAEPAGGPLQVAVAAAGRDGRSIARVTRPATVARGIGASVSSYISLFAIQASDGLVAPVSDDEIIRAHRDLGREGIFVEPASAAVLAALRVAAGSGEQLRDRCIVLVNTSTGLKNSDAIADSSGPALTISSADPMALEVLSAR